MLHAAQQQPSPGAREGPRDSPYSSSRTAPLMQDAARQSEASLRLQAPDSTHAQTARPCLEAAQSATRPTSSANGTSAQHGPLSTPSSYPQWPSQSHAASYFVTRTPNGFLITDLPPGYTLLIVTPTRCQILGPAAGVHSKELSSHDKEEHQLAAFAFKAESDGSIEALNLPPGTDITREVVGPEPHHLSLDSQARMRTTFSAVDGFTVCFEGHAAQGS